MIKVHSKNYRRGAGYLSRWRTSFVHSCFFLGFAILLLRAIYLQAVLDHYLLKKGQAISSHVVDIPASRGRILDRSGVVLAMSVPVRSVWLSPSDFMMGRFKDDLDRQHRLYFLKKLLNVKDSFFQDKMHSRADWVCIKKNVIPRIAHQIADLDIPGIYLQRDYKRYYPARESAAQLVGINDVNDLGQSGVERLFENVLHGTSGSRRVLRDRKGHAVDDVEAIRVPVQGKDVVLSIDHNLQEETYNALLEKVKETGAVAGSAMVVDTLTGEILALVNVPSLNPNNRRYFSWSNFRNRAFTDMFEPGSTMKPFAVSLALEQHKVTPNTVIDTEGGHFRVGTVRISDMHPTDHLTVTQIVQKSSNIGMSKIALRLNRTSMWRVLRQLGFGQITELGFGGEAAGILKPGDKWKKIEQVTISYGQGISVTLAQLVRAYTVFARHGQVIPLTILKTDKIAVGYHIFSPETMSMMINILATVVENGGTALRAKIDGYRVGGKTGTAYKVHGGRYVHRYVASFVGLAPLSHPRFVVGVMIDDPKGVNHYGGSVAAPVFHTIMLSALRRFIISPDRDEPDVFH
ncbi:peptidoglycan D,D-transpeptidase FtsI family protein [Candidatus Ichthyocystis hellenicum]|uniref:peptidoglycan D,D-transpeptidase FtsI family protein n=1 Tax=Candidatus Ichthyocystis hellenicum TaxID=1561003 RepID=UPI000A68B1FE|nr:penicillin-binding protein 2 [Candidatus Ichthyocystis hellenicum]